MAYNSRLKFWFHAHFQEKENLKVISLKQGYLKTLFYIRGSQSVGRAPLGEACCLYEKLF
jgi:hypothetical protein